MLPQRSAPDEARPGTGRGAKGAIVGDTTNWEFAAAVAAVCIGLGGLLLFTLLGTFNSWRLFSMTLKAAREAEKANLAVQELARHLSARTAQQLPVIDLSDAASEMTDLRKQADALIDQQARLQESVRNLVEAGVLGSEASQQQSTDLQQAMRRLEENMARIAIAVANLEANRKP